MTEKEMLTEAAKRLGVFNEKWSNDKEIFIEAYYSLRVSFDDDGKIVKFETHP